MAQKLISTEELKPGMTVLSIIGFADEYSALHSQKAHWVSQHFSKATARVKRKGVEIQIPGAEVQAEDQLLILEQLHQMEQSFLVLRDSTSQEMLKNGLTLLLVETGTQTHTSPGKATSLQQTQHTEFISQLIDKISLGLELKQQATDQVMQTFEALRNEQVTGKQVVSQVESILSNHGVEVLQMISLLEQKENVYQHSIDVAVLYHQLYFDFIARSAAQPAFSSRKEVFLSAFVHDFGMASLPMEVYESSQAFNRGSKEWDQIHLHPEAGAKILTQMGMPNTIVNMALYHHTKEDRGLTSHYPNHLNNKDAAAETKLLSLVDIFQALTSKRSYSKRWTPPAAMRFLEALVGSEFDSHSWDIFYRLMGQYPNGSLVKLSSGESAFVIGQAVDHSDRPIVVPVLTSEHELISHNDVLLLELNQDISVLADLSPDQEFQGNALEVFSSMQFNPG